MKKIHYLLLIFAFQPFFSHSQEIKKVGNDAIMEKIAETYIDKENEDLDLTVELDELEKLTDSPLDLNLATKEQLEQIFFLTSYQIARLIDYRNSVEQIYSIYELIAVEGFNLSLIEDIQNFIIIGEVNSPVKKSIKNEINLRSQYTIEDSEGFMEKSDTSKAYPGIRPKLFFQYKFEKDETLNIGFTAENDSGEEFFKGSNKSGFDFYSGHIGWTGKNIIKKIILGDYIVRFGQGIILWTGYGRRKSAESINIRFSGQGIKGYSSSNENSFLRGSAIFMEKGKFNLIAFYSNKNSDANITERDSLGIPIRVSSIQTSGYHRTKNEIEDERSINVKTLGTSLRINGNNFNSGVNFVYQSYNIPLIPNIRLYKKFHFTGKENYNISTDISYVNRKSTAFAEIAISKSGGLAFLAGMESNPVSEFSFSMLYRNYAPNFHSIGGNSISESGISNEVGFLTSFFWNPFPNTKISGYFDHYKSFWPDYNGVSAMNGTDVSINSEYSITSQIKFALRYSQKTSNKATLIESQPIKRDASVTNQKMRLKIEWRPLELITLNLRGEFSRYNTESQTSNGWLCMADASTSLLKNKLSFTIRTSVFNTDDYFSRIYAFESDIPNNNFIPSFCESGSRLYLYSKYNLTKKITLYFKIARTFLFDDEKTIGSGLNKINMNHKTDIKIQIKFRL